MLCKVQDVIRHAFDASAFRRFIDQLEAAVGQQITGDAYAAVEALGPAVGLTSAERQSVLRHLIEGGDLSRYGLMNAVTRTADDVDSYDRATELEATGCRLIGLAKRDWDRISAARRLALGSQ